MSQLLYGSICLTDIPKEKITVSEKNGKKYLNINVWVNDTPDQYGNSASISISQSKEEREAKTRAVYIGNLKANAPQRQTAAQTTTPGNNVQQFDNEDDLPF